MKTLITCVFILFLITIEEANAQPVYTADSLALVDLYNSTNGPQWLNKTNWLTAAPVSTWYGITVNGNRVIKILLNNNLLAGRLLYSLGDCKKLTDINLSNNYLVGQIPVSLGKLPFLENLNLSFNSTLRDSIPASFSNLTALKTLLLFNNRLSGNILNVSSLTHLIKLDLSSNKLTGSIPDLNNLSQLQYINVSNNRLTGVIPDVSNLQQIAYLNFGNNRLTGSIPASVGLLEQISFIGLYNNQLSGNIPPQIGNLYKLDTLSLSRNNLEGIIPVTLGNLHKLTFLELDYNRLSGNIPFTLSNDTALVYLGFSSNNLSGKVPAFLIDFKYLKSLDIGGNAYTFSGMEKIAGNISPQYAIYAPQENIQVHQHGTTLAVSAGGTLRKNKYYWYKDGHAYKTKRGDSTIDANGTGIYSVFVDNDVATQLTLQGAGFMYYAEDIAAEKINDKFSRVMLYPNPAKSVATILFNADGKYTIVIKDETGKMLQTKTGIANKGWNTIQLDVKNYSAGTYFIVITDDKKHKQVITMVKQ